MPHALTKRINGVRAEAESTATNLSASALSTPETGVNKEKHRTPRPARASPYRSPNRAPGPLSIRPTVSWRHGVCLAGGQGGVGARVWGWLVMRPDRYSRWVDPAPLEVERPRLPWWTLLPRKVLLAASPIILVAVVTTVVVFVVRRVWRYPLFLIGAVILA